MVECEFVEFTNITRIGNGFNRYMVECELESSSSRRVCYCVLIDTWWNVNTNKLYKITNQALVLIDTWWNVNKIILCEICLLIEF